MKPDRPRGRTKATRAPSGRQNIHKKPAPIAKFSPDYTRCTALSPSPNMVIESLSITMVLDLFFHVILISKEKLERNWHRSRWGDGQTGERLLSVKSSHALLFSFYLTKCRNPLVSGKVNWSHHHSNMSPENRPRKRTARMKLVCFFFFQELGENNT